MNFNYRLQQPWKNWCKFIEDRHWISRLLLFLGTLLFIYLIFAIVYSNRSSVKVKGIEFTLNSYSQITGITFTEGNDNRVYPDGSFCAGSTCYTNKNFYTVENKDITVKNNAVLTIGGHHTFNSLTVDGSSVTHDALDSYLNGIKHDPVTDYATDHFGIKYSGYIQIPEYNMIRSVSAKSENDRVKFNITKLDGTASSDIVCPGKDGYAISTFCTHGASGNFLPKGLYKIEIYFWDIKDDAKFLLTWNNTKGGEEEPIQYLFHGKIDDLTGDITQRGLTADMYSSSDYVYSDSDIDKQFNSSNYKFTRFDRYAYHDWGTETAMLNENVGIDLDITKSLTLINNGKIDVSGKGYHGGIDGKILLSGLGVGGNSYSNGASNVAGGGGGHGGVGGYGATDNEDASKAGKTNDNSDNPLDFGSGGGSAKKTSGNDVENDNSGSGGGIIKIYAHQNINICQDCLILANGGDGTDEEGAYSGAGSGGTINLQTVNYTNLRDGNPAVNRGVILKPSSWVNRAEGGTVLALEKTVKNDAKKLMIGTNIRSQGGSTGTGNGTGGGGMIKIDAQNWSNSSGQISVSKTVDKVPTPGQSVVFTLTLNENPRVASQYTLTDKFNHTVLLNVSGASGTDSRAASPTINQSQGTISWVITPDSAQPATYYLKFSAQIATKANMPDICSNKDANISVSASVITITSQNVNIKVTCNNISGDIYSGNNLSFGNNVLINSDSVVSAADTITVNGTNNQFPHNSMAINNDVINKIINKSVIEQQAKNVNMLPPNTWYLDGKASISDSEIANSPRGGLWQTSSVANLGNSPITYYNRGTIIYSGSSPIAFGQDLIASNKTKDYLGLIVSNINGPEIKIQPSGNSVEVDGLIYAPYSTVTIDNSANKTISIKGQIIAKNIVIVTGSQGMIDIAYNGSIQAKPLPLFENYTIPTTSDVAP